MRTSDGSKQALEQALKLVVDLAVALAVDLAMKLAVCWPEPVTRLSLVD